MDGRAELIRRVAQLNARLGDSDVEWFVDVWSEVTDFGQAGEPAGLSAPEADAIVAKSRLLRRISAAAPEIVDGPVSLNAQHWISTGNPEHLPQRHRRHLLPCESLFFGALDQPHTRARSKPFEFGLFTSTSIAGGRGMWRTYLDMNQGSTLFPLPWYTWAVEICQGVAVREITSAVEWVEFVRSYPRRNAELTYPDWSAVARDYAGVHMTARAIAATQGLCFPMSDGVVAAPYWDVESTVWLRWCVRSATLVNTVPDGG